MLIIPFLAETLEASRKGEIPKETGNVLFDGLVGLVMPALSLDNYHPKQKEKEPFWTASNYYYFDDNKPNSDQERFANQVATIYCHCCSTGYVEDASVMLKWLKSEVEIADIKVFPLVILPLLPALQAALDEYDIAISAEIQEAC